MCIGRFIDESLVFLQYFHQKNRYSPPKNFLKHVEKAIVRHFLLLFTEFVNSTTQRTPCGLCGKTEVQSLSIALGGDLPRPIIFTHVSMKIA